MSVITAFLAQRALFKANMARKYFTWLTCPSPLQSTGIIPARTRPASDVRTLLLIPRAFTDLKPERSVDKVLDHERKIVGMTQERIQRYTPGSNNRDIPSPRITVQDLDAPSNVTSSEVTGNGHFFRPKGPRSSGSRTIISSPVTQEAGTDYLLPVILSPAISLPYVAPKRRSSTRRSSL